jgi:hypothetical protein
MLSVRVQLCTWSPNKLWISNSICNLWSVLEISLYDREDRKGLYCTKPYYAGHNFFLTVCAAESIFGCPTENSRHLEA